MLELILVRHGQTLWNFEKVFRGRSDIPLAEEGVKQAEALAEYLSGEAVDAVFCSPLLRALQTAEPISKVLDVPLYRDEGLIDVDFGRWSGLSREEVRRRFPNEWTLWRKGELSLRFPGGESLKEARQRFVEFLSSCRRNLTDKRIAVVTHRVPLKLIITHVFSADEAFWRVRFDTASVTRIEHNGRFWILKSLNDTSHLRQGRPEEDF